MWSHNIKSAVLRGRRDWARDNQGKDTRQIKNPNANDEATIATAIGGVLGLLTTCQHSIGSKDGVSNRSGRAEKQLKTCKDHFQQSKYPPCTPV